ncbi:MAG: LPXTG cell wall anchor domain-containing protein [Peptococcaceae bacterium]|nr:LPXTG cell wall anchor domain-containing protein [Peptococcaceae bacterium]
MAILLSIGLLLPYPTDMVRAVVEGFLPIQECTHHLTHTADCGYVAAVEGHPCNHVHDETCGYVAPVTEDRNDAGTAENAIASDSLVLDNLKTGKDDVVSDDLKTIADPKEDAGKAEADKSEADKSEDSEKPAANTCKHVHDAACGYVEAVPGHPCEFVCDICNPVAAAATPILAWQWVDEEEYLVFDEAAQMWYLSLPGAGAENPVTREVLLNLLPAEISAEISAEYRIPVALSWDLSAIPEDGIWSGQLVLQASVSQEYRLEADLPALTVVLDLGGTTTFLSESQLKDHIVTEGIVNPAGVTVNLFDYWVNDETEPNYNGKEPKAPNGDLLGKNHRHNWSYKGSASSTATPFSSSEDWNRGINQNHLLLFGDGVIHGGLWNKGAGSGCDYGQNYAGMEGIVKPVLSGGYPEINLSAAKQSLTGNKDERDWDLVKYGRLSAAHIVDATVTDGTYWDWWKYPANPPNLSDTVVGFWQAATGQSIDSAAAKESLDYLFNPHTNHSSKKSYENVTGLFQLDDQGYYTYSMRNNFAEFVYEPVGRDMEASDGHFILYDAPGTTRTDDASMGNFFPFNKGTEVFTDIVGGKLVSATQCFANSMNHHFGMSLDIAMRQPIGGMINMGSENNPMIFQFAGDDDVWVFVDDVLVLDLGGVHSEIYGTIDFSTGIVNIGRSFGAGAGDGGIPENPADPDRLVTQTNLRDLFKAAGKEDVVSWNGNTFSSNTDHHLRMFYLERGNYDSSLTLRFNIQPLLYQQIKKVDKFGNPLAGVEFALYEAQKNGGSYTAVGDVLATLTTDVDGFALFTSNVARKDGAGRVMYEPFNFNDRANPYYILKETSTPDGYRGLPIDIVLEYNPTTTMLRVVNRWTTGAYSSFTSTVAGNKNVTYGHYNVATGNIDADMDKTVPLQKQKDGLVLAIPMMLQENSTLWQAVHGSNTNGFSLVRVDPEHYTVDEWRKATLAAAIYQCAEYGGTTPGWYLDWSTENYRLEGTLTDLPGRADRYKLSNPDGDMMMVYGIIEPNAFAALGITAANSGDRYEALGAYVRDLAVQLKTANPALTAEEALSQAVQQTTNQIMAVNVAGTGSNKGFSFLNVSQFNRNFRSMIYIPNEQRELYVQKIDQNGRPVNGAVFGLYDNEECAGDPVASGATARVNNQEGVLVFTPIIPDGVTAGQGYAEMVWVNEVHDRAEPYFWLKEISAPAGYEINPTITPVVVGIYSIYADAGTADNGISVMAGVGKLVQTMVKFASDGDVNITLRDIQAIGQTQSSGAFAIDGWHDMALQASTVARTMNLHYGMNAVIDYGLHDEDGGKNINPYLITDTGFIRVRVKQNYERLFDEPSSALKDLVSDDITSLFSLVNFVVVTDQTTEKTQTGKLTISKMLSGAGLLANDYVQNFRFQLELTDKDGKGLPGEYYFYGTNKTGYVQNGDIIPLHHDESITVLGLPEGTKFKVTEENAVGWYVFPKAGFISGSIQNGKTAKAAFGNRKQEWPAAGDLTISKVVTGTDGESDKAFTFTVTFTNAAGAALTGSFNYDGDKAGAIASGETITLKSGESITIHSLPANAHYTITEAEAGQDRYTTESTGETGIIKDGEIHEAVFTNHRDLAPTVGNLIIRKTVSGSAGDRNKEFTFSLTLTDAEGNALAGRFDYDGAKNGDIASGETVTLKHGQSITIHNIPAGSQYGVTEEEAGKDGYTTTSSGNIGMVVGGKVATAAFINQKGGSGGGSGNGDSGDEPEPKGNLIIRKTVTGSEGDKNKEFTFKVTLTNAAGSAIDDNFQYDGVKVGTIASGKTLTLKDGDVVTIHNIPADTNYVVEEQEAGGDGYTTTSSGDIGTIKDNQNAIVLFINHKGDDKEPDDSNGGGDNSGGNDNHGGDGNKGGDSHQGNSGENTGKNTYDVTPKTGDNSLTSVWAALVLISLLAILLLLRYRSKEK